MLETITLLGERQKLQFPNRVSLLAYVIVGIECTNGTTIRMRDDDPRYPAPHTREPRRIPFTFGAAGIGRIAAMYESTFARGEELNYDCSGFTLYAMGAKDAPTCGDFRSEYIVGGHVYPNDLAEGTPYGIIGWHGRSVHAMLGAAPPTHSLGAIGKSIEGGGLLVYAANTHLLVTYEGTRIGEITRGTESIVCQ